MRDMALRDRAVVSDKLEKRVQFEYERARHSASGAAADARNTTAIQAARTGPAIDEPRKTEPGSAAEVPSSQPRKSQTDLAEGGPAAVQDKPASASRTGTDRAGAAQRDGGQGDSNAGNAEAHYASERGLFNENQ